MDSLKDKDELEYADKKTSVDKRDIDENATDEESKKELEDKVVARI